MGDLGLVLSIILATYCALSFLYILGCWIVNNGCAEAEYTYSEFMARGGRLKYCTTRINEHIVKIPFSGYIKLVIKYFVDGISETFKAFIEERSNRPEKFSEGRKLIDKEVFGE